MSSARNGSEIVHRHPLVKALYGCYYTVFEYTRAFIVLCDRIHVNYGNTSEPVHKLPFDIIYKVMRLHKFGFVRNLGVK